MAITNVYSFDHFPIQDIGVNKNVNFPFIIGNAPFPMGISDGQWLTFYPSRTLSGGRWYNRPPEIYFYFEHLYGPLFDTTTLDGPRTFIIGFEYLMDVRYNDSYQRILDLRNAILYPSDLPNVPTGASVYIEGVVDADTEIVTFYADGQLIKSVPRPNNFTVDGGLLRDGLAWQMGDTSNVDYPNLRLKIRNIYAMADTSHTDESPSERLGPITIQSVPFVSDGENDSWTPNNASGIDDVLAYSDLEIGNTTLVSTYPTVTSDGTDAPLQLKPVTEALSNDSVYLGFLVNITSLRAPSESVALSIEENYRGVDQPPVVKSTPPSAPDGTLEKSSLGLEYTLGLAHYETLIRQDIDDYRLTLRPTRPE